MTREDGQLEGQGFRGLTGKVLEQGEGFRVKDRAKGRKGRTWSELTGNNRGGEKPGRNHFKTDMKNRF